MNQIHGTRRESPFLKVSRLGGALVSSRGPRASDRLGALNGIGFLLWLVAVALAVMWWMKPAATDSAEITGVDLPTTSEALEVRTVSSPASFDADRLFQQPKVRVASRSRRANVTLSELSRRLKLQGIVWGDNPRVIVENGATDQVLYLLQGEYVGEIQILEIRKTSVVLAWKDETLELIL